MDLDGSQIIQLLFWTFAAGVLFLPKRWAVISYLVLVHCDLAADSSGSMSAIGLAKAVKVAAPAILLLRMRMRPLTAAKISWTGAAWIGLVLYASAAASWSPFPNSALKMVAYLVAYPIVYLVLSYGWSQSWLNERSLLLVFWASLALALWRTYGLGGAFAEDGERLASFASAQSFAGYLVAVFAILCFTGRWTVPASASASAIIVCVFLTGSRYALFGLLALLVLVWIIYSVKARDARTRVGLLVKGFAAVVTLAALLAGFLEYYPESRVNALFKANPFGVSNFYNAGTFVWRLGVYEETIEVIRNQGFATLLLGLGTSSGGDFMLRYDRRYRIETLDPNRVLHNEVLRSIYEWGLVGSLLLISFLMLLARDAIREAAGSKSWRAFAVVVLFPTMLLSLTVENMLAGPGGPGGVGLAMVVAYGLGRRRIVYAPPTWMRPVTLTPSPAGGQLHPLQRRQSEAPGEPVKGRLTYSEADQASIRRRTG